LRRYYGKIQDKGDDYYMQFNLVICGLDSVEARRWINATLVNLVDPSVPESMKPLIDGGTEGMRQFKEGVLYFQTNLPYRI
jgi:NEDD8-activating enzyme E1